MEINCNKCAISEKRKRIVTGRGSLPADILFMNEAPNKSEDAGAAMLLGPSGALLETLIRIAAGNLRFKLMPTYYIVSTVLCRPYVLDKNDDAFGATREPTTAEIFNCTPNILKIIAQVKPKVTVFIGDVSYDNYHRELVEHVRILSPVFLLKHGGKTSPHYLSTVRKMEDALMHIGGQYGV